MKNTLRGNDVMNLTWQFVVPFGQIFKETNPWKSKPIVLKDTEVILFDISCIPCVPGIWTSLTWQWWFDFRLEPILAKD